MGSAVIDEANGEAKKHRAPALILEYRFRKGVQRDVLDKALPRALLAVPGRMRLFFSLTSVVSR